MGICDAFWRENKKMEGTSPSATDIAGPLDVSRVFVSSGVPDRASGGLGWSGLSRWIKDLFHGKMRKRRYSAGDAGASQGRWLEMLSLVAFQFSKRNDWTLRKKKPLGLLSSSDIFSFVNEKIILTRFKKI
jgi:hypothetical protein